ncbi:subtilisin-like protease 2 isoform X2 [Leptidea sinapis]|uniref:subtilisin-like protease 2 isoform X2 n=1 Tax=Leptidea sinapis TaxID=189913 RepID=UPI0021C455C4|nr:subtilisin-like protease 2 isoform X2 [Leptidea sinapis]
MKRHGGRSDFVNARLSHKKIHNRNQPINNFGSSYSSFDLTEEVVDSFYKSDEFKALSNTSDSFIRKRVTEKDLVPSCCTLTKDIRYEGLLKPLIKITVIPNLKLFKHINTRKYFRSSASNENNSIDREVCYISQKGRKNRKENIYAIKLSESVNDYRKNHHEQMHIEQNYKQLLDSMNMDKNFKRNRKKERHDEHETRSRDIQRNRSTSKDRTPHADPSKSRVTIFGQLGLNENDQFVLNCAATVNDESVPTNVTQINPMRSSKNMENTNKQKNSTQSYERYKEQPFESEYSRNYGSDKCVRMESQGVQVNFCISKNNTKDKIMCDKIIQCVCNNGEETALTKNISEGNILKECRSPIVIISVYQNQENNDNNIAVTVEKGMQPQKNINTKYRHKDENKRKFETKIINVSNYTQKSRSPSPVKAQKESDQKSFRPKVQSEAEYRTIKNKPIVNRLESLNHTPNFKRKDRLVKQNVNELQRMRYNQKGQPSLRTMIVERSETKETEVPNTFNTRNNLKRNLIDGHIKEKYSNEIIKHKSKERRKLPDKDNSKLTVNIDGDNEHYDVYFQQTKFNTDLAVRKTLKNYMSNKLIPSKDENHLWQRNDSKQRTKSYLQESPPSVSRDNQNNGRRISKLSARDSLEISQRRGMHSITSPGKLKTSKRDQQIGEANHSGLSNDPKKHYTGDNCSLEDPIERDKEIRELLGLLTRSKDDTKICQSKDCNEFKGSDDKCECVKIFRT